MPAHLAADVQRRAAALLQHMPLLVTADAELSVALSTRHRRHGNIGSSQAMHFNVSEARMRCG